MLARLRRSPEETDEGFTMIEVLIVVTILAILATIVIPVLLNQRKKGWDAAAKSDLRQAANAEEVYLASNGTYTSLLVDLTASGFKPTAGILFADGFFYTRAADALNTAYATPAKYPGSFCMTMKSQSGNWFVYDSLKGGLQVINASCP